MLPKVSVVAPGDLDKDTPRACCSTFFRIAKQAIIIFDLYCLTINDILLSDTWQLVYFLVCCIDIIVKDKIRE
jgi:hypothetical protein